MRAWQATRPSAMRRPRNEPDPKRARGSGDRCLDDVLEAARPMLKEIENLRLKNFRQRTDSESYALRNLWQELTAISLSNNASCVGITKAVLLLTNGEIGPAFDKDVRRRLRVPRFLSPEDWFHNLEAVAEDIQSFEIRHGPLASVVQDFHHLRDGRLYDMVVGPRD